MEEKSNKEVMRFVSLGDSNPSVTGILDEFPKKDITLKKLYDKKLSSQSFITAYEVKIKDGREYLLRIFHVQIYENFLICKILRECCMSINFGAYCNSILKVYKARFVGFSKENKLQIEALGELPGKAINSFKGSCSYSEAIKWGYDVCVTLEKMERCGISHINIKPDSIFLKEINEESISQRAVLGNLGTVFCCFQDTKQILNPVKGYSDRITGWSKYFLPPEVLENTDLANIVIPQKCDVFAFGLTLTSLLLYSHNEEVKAVHANPPGSDKEYLENIVKKLKERNLEQWVEVVEKCLCRKVEERLTFKELKKKMEEVDLDLHKEELDIERQLSKAKDCKNENRYYAAIWAYEDCKGAGKKDLAFLYNKIGNYKKSIEICESLLNEHIDPEQLLDIMLILINSAARLVIIEKMEEYDKQIIKLLEDLSKVSKEHSWKMIKLHEAWGIYYELTGEYKRSLKKYKEADRLSTKEFGEEHEETLLMRCSVGKLLAIKCKLKKAGTCLKEVASIIGSKKWYNPALEIELCTAKGYLHASLQKFIEAKEFYNYAMTGIQLLFGEDHPKIIEVYLGLASSVSDKNTILTDYLQKAHIIAQKVYEKSHPTYILTVTTIADAYIDLSLYHEARGFVEEASFKGITDPSNYNEVLSAFFMGKINYLLEKLPTAIPYLENSIKGLEKQKKEQTSVMIQSLITLGLICISSMDFNKALNCFNQAKKHHKNVYYKSHPTMAFIAIHIASIYVSMEDPNSAEEALKTIDDSLNLLTTSKNPLIGKYYAEKAKISILRSKFKEGKDYLSKGFKLLEDNKKTVYMSDLYNALGILHVEKDKCDIGIKHHIKAEETVSKSIVGTAEVYRLIGDAFLRMADYKSALASYSSALSIIEKVWSNVPVTGLLKIRIGESLCYMEKYTKSLDCYKQMQNPSTEEELKDFALLLHICIAENLIEQKKYKEAFDMLKKAEDVSLKLNKGYYLRKVRVMGNLGYVYRELKDHKKSIEYYEKAEKTIKEVFGENAKEIADIKYNYAILKELQVQNENLNSEYKPIIDLYNKSLEIVRNVYGKNHQDEIEIYRRMEKAYNRANMKVEAYNVEAQHKELCLNMDDKSHKLARISAELGAISNKLDIYDNAIDYLNKAINIIESTNKKIDKKYITDIYMHLVYAYNRKGSDDNVKRTFKIAEEKRIDINEIKRKLNMH